MGSIRSKLGRFMSVFAVMAVAMATVVLSAPQAQAAAVLSFPNTQYTPGLGWDVVGLDSNNVNAGGNQYAKGVRVCNTGDATATNVVVRWFFDATPTPSPYINLQAGTPDTLNFTSLAAGACLDAYFNIEVTRNTAAWNTYSRYHITATADGLGTISTQNCFNTEALPGACGTGPYDGYRQLFVEKLIGQNRNNVNYIKYMNTTTADNNGGGVYACTNGVNTGTGSNVVIVGYEYYICLSSSTATNGYEQITTYINLPNIIFQTLSVASTYTAPVGATGDQIYEDACQWYQNPYNTEYWRKNNSDDCQGTGKYGGEVQMIFKVRIISAGGPSTASGLVYDFSGSSFHYNGGTSAGNWLVCPDNCFVWEAKNKPWAASFESATATRTPAGTDVAWTTGFEADNLGFNVYAGEADSRVKVNGDLIAGSALGVAGPLNAGGKYRWLVPPGNGPPEGPFWVESVGTDGSREMNGPIQIEGSAPQQVRASSTLSDLGSLRGTSTLLGRTASPGGDGSVAASLAQGPAAKVGVDHEGWYRVPLPEIEAAGVDVSDPARLHLYAEGVEQPFQIRDGGMEFYGLGLDTNVTATRVYWIVAGDGPAPAVGTIDPAPGSPGATSFPATVERRDRNIYFATLLNGNGNNFFGAPVNDVGTDQLIDVPDIADASGATVDVSLRGVTSGPHAVDVALNGQPLGTVTFEGRGSGSVTFPATGLQEGANTVRLSSAGPVDVSLVDAIRVHYQRTLTATDDTLRFTAEGGSQVTVDGFASDAIRVVDVTDPAAPVEVTVAVSGGYSATLTVPGVGGRSLYAFADPVPASAESNRPSHLRSPSNRADMLIIAPRSMKAALRPLVKLHRSEGLRTRFIDVVDVWDEFGAGERGPRPIRDFLTFAHTRWSTAPRYVLLGGDASLDPRGFIGRAASDVVPTKMVDTSSIETASDNWLADADRDLLPDVAIGRLPAGTASEMEAMVAKTRSYVKLEPSRSVVIPYDGGSDYDFAREARMTQRSIPTSMDVVRISGSDPDARARLIEAIDAGPSVVNYVGHGSTDLWRNGLFTGTDAEGLTNEHPVFFVAMTCLNGYFEDSGLDSLSESMLKAPSGAVAAWASSGYTYPREQRSLSDALYGALYSESRPTVGESVQTALNAATSTDDLRTWTLFGDPAVRIR